MEREFVNYNQALKLKTLGFDEPCLLNVWWLNDTCTLTKKLFEPLIGINGNDIDFEYNLPKEHPLTKGKVIDIGIPTFSQAFRWFREKGYDVKVIKESPGLYFGFYWNGAAWIMVGNGTYEASELACLDKLIEIVENK